MGFLAMNDEGLTKQHATTNNNSISPSLKNKLTAKIKRIFSNKRSLPIVFIIAFVVIGLIFLLGSFAETPQTSIDPKRPIAQQLKALSLGVSMKNEAFAGASARAGVSLQEKSTAKESLVSVLEQRKKAMQFAIAHEPKYALANAMSTEARNALPKDQQGNVEERTTIEGTLSYVHAETSDMGEAKATKTLSAKLNQQRPYIETNEGKHVYLSLAGTLGKDVTAGQKIRISGVKMGSTMATDQQATVVTKSTEDPVSVSLSSSVGRLSSSFIDTPSTLSVTSSQSAPTSLAPSTMNMGVFMINFERDSRVSNNPLTGLPYNKNDLEGVFKDNGTSFKKFYEEQSYGKISVTAKVNGWITLPMDNRVECYLTSDGYYDTSVDYLEYLELFGAGVIAQLDARGYATNQYSNVAFFYNHFQPTGYGVNEDNCYLSGTGFSHGIPSRYFTSFLNSDLADTPQKKLKNIRWINNIAHHEVGHNIDLFHSHGDCILSSDPDQLDHTCIFGAEYGDEYDNEGGGGYFGSSRHYNAYQKLKLGWIKPGQIQTVTQSTSEYYIHNIETPLTDSSQRYAIFAPTHRTDINWLNFLTLEYRVNTNSIFDRYNITESPDDIYSKSNKPGVLVHRAPDTPYYPLEYYQNRPYLSSVLLNRKNITTPIPDKPWVTYQTNDSALSQNESYFDAASNICVKALNNLPARARVRVTFSCTHDGAKGMVQTPSGKGYYIFRDNGEVQTYGDAKFFGSVFQDYNTIPQPIVDLVPTSTGNGYWQVAKNGKVYTYGDARHFGGLPSSNVTRTDVVGIARTNNDQGYWITTADGSIYTYGNAQFKGTAKDKGVTVNDIIDIAGYGDNGYWLVGKNGGVYSFGNTDFHGSLPGQGVSTNKVRGITRTESGKGYWLTATDGGVFAFGDAQFKGSLPSQKISKTNINGIAGVSNNGYWLVGTDGAIYSFGDVQFYGRFEK